MVGLRKTQHMQGYEHMTGLHIALCLYVIVRRRGEVSARAFVYEGDGCKSAAGLELLQIKELLREDGV